MNSDGTGRTSPHASTRRWNQLALLNWHAPSSRVMVNTSPQALSKPQRAPPVARPPHQPLVRRACCEPLTHRYSTMAVLRARQALPVREHFLPLMLLQCPRSPWHVGRPRPPRQVAIRRWQLLAACIRDACQLQKMPVAQQRPHHAKQDTFQAEILITNSTHWHHPLRVVRPVDHS